MVVLFVSQHSEWYIRSNCVYEQMSLHNSTPSLVCIYDIHSATCYMLSGIRSQKPHR
uniref:Uncharacterized protein n=1 Tax=Arion vulgaris TaxID=1028688 RepID=A0A0B7AGE9_9EUPU